MRSSRLDGPIRAETLKRLTPKGSRRVSTDNDEETERGMARDKNERHESLTRGQDESSVYYTRTLLALTFGPVAVRGEDANAVRAVVSPRRSSTTGVYRERSPTTSTAATIDDTGTAAVVLLTCSHTPRSRHSTKTIVRVGRLWLAERRRRGRWRSR